MGEKVVCNLEISRAKPYLLVILVQFGYAGMVILAKTALNEGMNHYTFAESEATNDYLNFLQDNGAGLVRASFRPELVLCGDGVYIGNFCSSYVQHSSCPYLFDGSDLSYKCSTRSHQGLYYDHNRLLLLGQLCHSPSSYIEDIPPAELSLTALICGGGTLQGAILTLIVEKGNTFIWSIHFDTKLLAALYSGLICTGLSYYISGIIMREKGPVFATAFNPLSMVIVAIMGSFILSEQLDIRRIIRAIIIVIGLYLVIWGKSKDHNLSNSNKDDKIVDVLSVSSTSKVPINNEDV
ncbi:hypothetical protein LguiB_027396 [Lonicera macranthoides]